MNYMKRLIFIALMALCSMSFGVELICSGINTIRISNIRGDVKGKTNWEGEIKAEISLDTSKSVPVVKKIFSAGLDVSWCFYGSYAKNFSGQCNCKIDDEEIFCSRKYEDDFSSLTVSRKTAIAKIIQIQEWGSKESNLSYTVNESAELQCQVFEKNKF